MSFPYTEEMMESVKKVEATRAARMAAEPRRMTAEERMHCLSSIIQTIIFLALQRL